MNRRPHLLAVASALCAGLLALAPAPAPAQQVVVDGGAPNQGIGWNIFDDNRAASFFSIDGDASFDHIRFWAILPDETPHSANIFWQILTDDGGSPSSTVAAQGIEATTSTVRTELTDFPGFYSHVFDLALVGSRTLGAGSYWLTVHDGVLDPFEGTHSTMFWETSDAAGGANRIQTFSIDDSWVDNGPGGLAFQLTGPGSVIVTPEPTSLVLLASGLLLIAGARSRRRA